MHCARLFVAIAVSTVAAGVAGDPVVGGIQLEPGPNDRVTVSRKDWSWRSGAKQNPASTVTFDSGRSVYAIRYNQEYGRGTLGLSLPTRCNWYESGAFWLEVNGERLDWRAVNDLSLDLQEGERGVGSFRWETSAGVCVCRFIMPRAADRIFVDIRLTPSVEVTSLRLLLKAYPSGFNRDQPRHVLRTTERAITKKGRHRLEVPAEMAVFFADQALDPAEGRGQGPCAVVLDPAHVTSLHADIGGYGTAVAAEMDPTRTRVRFCLVEFPEMDNVDAWDAFAASVPTTLTHLADDTLFGISDETH